MEGRDSNEAAFLAAYSAEAFPKPSVTVDVVLLAVAGGSLKTILIRRAEQPGRGKWALPGGFVRLTESLDAAAARVMHEKARLANIYLEQLYTFGRPDRDPRMRIITVAYYALIGQGLITTLPLRDDMRLFTVRAPAGNIVRSVELLDDDDTPIVPAFDHRDIIAQAVTRVRGKLNYVPLGYELVPPEFTLLALAQVHEILLGTRLNKDSFRRRVLASGELVPTGTFEDDVDHRPAALYRRASSGEHNG